MTKLAAVLLLSLVGCVSPQLFEGRPCRDATDCVGNQACVRFADGRAACRTRCRGAERCAAGTAVNDERELACLADGHCGIYCDPTHPACPDGMRCGAIPGDFLGSCYGGTLPP